MAPRLGLGLLACAAALGALRGCWHLEPQVAFLPGPAQHATAARHLGLAGPRTVAAAVAALSAAPAAHADEIDDAAVKLTQAAYPFLKSVKWDSNYFLTLPGASPDKVAKAIAKTLEMGAAMDGEAVKAGVKAHSLAISAIDKDGVTSQANFEKINAAIGHMIASAGEAKTMEVYRAWEPLVPSGAPEYLQGTVKASDAEAAYKALLEFKDVVKKEAPKFAAAPAGAPREKDVIDIGAKRVSEAAYPFMKDVDWNADYLLTLPGVKPQATLKAIQKALDQGAGMDWATVREGALAHAKAINNVDAKGVLPLEDFIAINTAIGHMIKSSGRDATMSTYNAFKDITPQSIVDYQFSKIPGDEAKVAYKALLKFTYLVTTLTQFGSAERLKPYGI